MFVVAISCLVKGGAYLSGERRKVAGRIFIWELNGAQQLKPKQPRFN
jgi:hypothetical protein